MKRLLILALMLIAVDASAQIQEKHTFWGTLGTTWTQKTMSAGGASPSAIRGYVIENYSTTATDTLWVGHVYSGRIDTAVTYRHFVLPGYSSPSGVTNLTGVYIKAKTSAVPYQLILWNK